MLYGPTLVAHVKLRKELLRRLADHGFCEPPEVPGLVQNVRANRQIVIAFFVGKSAEKPIGRALQGLYTVELINKQCKFEYVTTAYAWFQRFKVQELAQREHWCRLVVHVDLSCARPDGFAFGKASTKQCPEDLAGACQDAGVHLHFQLRVIAIFDNEHNVTEFA